MSMNNAYTQYKENSVFTASPEELTLMLYNGLIKFIMLGQKALDEKDMKKAHESVVRAEDIIQEFMASLNMKYDVSQNMMLLYDYMYRRLIEANIKKDREILDEVLIYAKDFRDTWAQAMKIARIQQPRHAVAE